MENLSSGEQSDQKVTIINVQVPSSENIAKRRPLILTSFALAIVFFFFTFCTVQCQNQKIGSLTGFELVTGTNLKSRHLIREKNPASIWAIIALVAAVIGLGVFLIKKKNEAEVGTGAGIIGFASLLILQFVINNRMNAKTDGQVEVNFQFGYWGALISFGVASFISYLRISQTQKVELHNSPPASVIVFNTIRWIAVLPLVILTVILSEILVQLIDVLIIHFDWNKEAGFMLKYSTLLIYTVIGGYASVLVGAFVAPNFKKYVALIILICYAMLFIADESSMKDDEFPMRYIGIVVGSLVAYIKYGVIKKL